MPSPTPLTLTIEMIEEARKELTDLQWDEFTKNARGLRISFSGEVIEVYSDGRVQIQGEERLFTIVMLYQLPRETALQLNKDSSVKGVGTVKEIEIFLGLRVEINVGEIDIY